MSDQHYLMTEEQIQKLKDLNLPYCPSAFDYVGGKFGKYKAYIKLASFKAFHFAGSEDLEQIMGPHWRKYKHD